MSEKTASESIVDKVRNRYGRIAAGEISGCGPTPSGCCGSPEMVTALGIGYSKDDIDTVDEGANLGLGCGAPIGHLDLKPGETVLDLGSGAGFDAFLAARAVGPEGRVIGVDMTPEMLDKARANAAKMNLAHVEFREGRLEALPLDDASVDAVTSNCVINLVPDKAAVFREVARVLKPGGRLVVSDIILDGDLPAAITDDVLAYVGCVAGAMRRERYFALLGKAGLGDLTVLRDVDFLQAAGYAFTPELRANLEAAGIRDENLRGVVRSVTYRARRDH